MHAIHRTSGAIASAVLALLAGADPPEFAGEVRRGEPIGAEAHGPSVVETMDAVIARDLARREVHVDAPPKRGQWAVPSLRATFYPHSGARYVTNENGGLVLGISFPAPVDVLGVHVAGQAKTGVWPGGVRVIGQRGGAETGRTDWFRDVDDHPDRFDIALRGVDRIVFEAEAAFRGRAWYALDDLEYAPLGEGGGPGKPIILDFEDTTAPQVLSGSGYAGLVWEFGDVVPVDAQGDLDDGGADEAVHAPKVPEPDVPGPPPAPGGGAAGASSGLGTPPVLELGFQGVLRGDAGSASFPPDSHGAIGPEHYVVTVNRNFAVYDRRSGQELVNVHLQSFLPDSNGDPRVVWDHFAQRFIVLVSDFTATESIFLAVSATDDALGAWFKTSFATDQGSDAGCWPDYPTLGFDEDGIYTSAYMVGCGITIFAIHKGPLLGSPPALGAITAFRGLPFEGAIQPMVAHGDSNGHLFVSTETASSLRVRQLTGPITAPVLVSLGSVSVPPYLPPPDVPALGSATNLDHTVGTRLLNAVYRDGSIHTCHDVAVAGRSACRWYQIGVAGLQALQVGTVSHPSLHYFYGSIAVNAAGDAVMGFSGSNAGQYAACYFTGRRADDPPGAMAQPLLLREGEGPQNNIDGFGRNRWGDYSMTSIDPADDATFWTIQEYAHAVNVWGTWIGRIGITPALEYEYPLGQPDIIDPGGDEFSVTILGEDLDAASPRLHYSAGKTWQEIPLVPAGGGEYLVVFPPIECPSDVAYYLSAATTGGTVVNDPFAAPAQTYETLAALDLLVVTADDLEAPDSGWSVGSPLDDATTGIWERVDPVGTTAQPEDDHTPDPGAHCFVTGQGEVDGQPPANDVDGGQTTLLSPLFDATGLEEPTVSYFRWYSNGAGGSPNTDVFVVNLSNDGGFSWVNVETLGPAGPGTAGGWIHHEFAVSDHLVPTGSMRVQFIASDEGMMSLVEAAVDDFRVTSTVCDDEPDVPGDLNGDGEVNVEDLVQLILAWGPCAGACAEDLTGDGEVDVEDLVVLVLNWG